MSKTKEDFIAHFHKRYTNPYPPAWMLAEIIPFGTLFGIYNNLRSAGLKKQVANSFGLSFPIFSSWLLALVNTRNLCAHQSRTWNKEVSLIPANLKNPVHTWVDTTTTNPKRIYYRLCMIKYLLFTVAPHNTFTQKLKALLAQFPTVDIRAMGFPATWQDEQLWQ
jgi:abortive infection bacteriophage resistance protein